MFSILTWLSWAGILAIYRDLTKATMRYRLRTLLTVVAIEPPLLAGAWWGVVRYREWPEWRELEAEKSRVLEILTKALRDADIRVTSASGNVEPSDQEAQSGLEEAERGFGQEESLRRQVE
jgi:hypothetical protein